MRLQFLPGSCHGRSEAEFTLALTGSWQKLSLYLWEKVIPAIFFFPSVITLAVFLTPSINLLLSVPMAAVYFSF
jgi:hypothetical protein